MIAPIEGILYLCGEEGISKNDLKKILNISDQELEEAIFELKKIYDDDSRGIKIEFYGDCLKLVTKVEYCDIFSKLVEVDANKPLSTSALEVLAIVAYNQPITRIKIDEVRGVNSHHMVRKLLLKELIEETGRSNLPGRPILYKTTVKFLDCLGIKDLNELPNIEIQDKDIEESELFSSKYKEKI